MMVDTTELWTAQLSQAESNIARTIHQLERAFEVASEKSQQTGYVEKHAEKIHHNGFKFNIKILTLAFLCFVKRRIDSASN